MLIKNKSLPELSDTTVLPFISNQTVCELDSLKTSFFRHTGSVRLIVVACGSLDEAAQQSNLLALNTLYKMEMDFFLNGARNVPSQVIADDTREYSVTRIHLQGQQASSPYSQLGYRSQIRYT